jgi:hypothetical protein
MQPYGTVLAMLKPEKLGKLLRLQSSDKDGDALAATAAIKRTLATEGLGIHGLADALCHPALREHKFVAEMVTWTRRVTPTDRQQVWLLIILNGLRHG